MKRKPQYGGFQELALDPVEEEITKVVQVVEDDSGPWIDPRPYTAFVTRPAPVDPGPPPKANTRGAADPADMHPSLRNAPPAKFNTVLEPHGTKSVRAHLPIFTSWRSTGRERRPACNTRSKGSRRGIRAGPSSDDDPHEQPDLDAEWAL